MAIIKAEGKLGDLIKSWLNLYEMQYRPLGGSIYEVVSLSTNEATCYLRGLSIVTQTVQTMLTDEQINCVGTLDKIESIFERLETVR